MVTLARLVLLELLVPLVLLAQLVQLANRETEERMAHKDLLAPLDRLELEAWLDPKDLVVIKVRQENLEKEVRRDTEDSPVCRVCQDLQVLLETRVLPDLLDQLAPRDHPDPLDQLVRTVLMVSLDPLDHLDLVDALESLAQLVHLVTQDLLVLLVPLALALTCLPSLGCLRLRKDPILCVTCVPTRPPALLDNMMWRWMPH